MPNPSTLARNATLFRFLPMNLPRACHAGWMTVALALATAATPAQAQAQRFHFGIQGDTLRCGGYDRVQAVVWFGRDSRMSLARLAAYCAPVIWFSPDEPLLHEHSGKDITIPEAFPFEAAGTRPVVYYRVRTLQTAARAPAPSSPSPATVAPPSSTSRRSRGSTWISSSTTPRKPASARTRTMWSPHSFSS